jgi:hypothetical protein
MKKKPLRAVFVAFGMLFLQLSVEAGSVITDNLPAGTTIVNIDARADGAATYSSDSDQTFWYQPTSTAPSVTLPRGAYRFRIIDPQDAASLYPQLTSAQLAQIYTAWSYNSPWTENYMVFQNTALTDPTEHQLFDGAIAPGAPTGTTFSSAQAAYDGTVANGYYNKIRPAPPGRSALTTDYVTEYTFIRDTTVLCIVPDNGLFDNSGGVSVVITAIPAPTPGAQLANISTREFVQTNDNVLIGGFIVTGTQPKKVVVRALGPSLPVTGALANPTLELYSGTTLLATNDNWVDSPDKQSIQDSGLAPKDNLESAIIGTLPANNSTYTAIVRGANNTTGVGLVEAYDIDRSVDSRLANISTRGVVQTSDNVMIAGFIVVGGSNQNVIIRAIGPSLNIPGQLNDPVLELRDKNGDLIGSNDNWRVSGQKAEIEQTGVPPSDDRESAIYATLPAGDAAYTAIVRSANGTSGIALVEVYALQ